MKPLSIDLRQRIVQAYENQEGSQQQIAERFRVSVRSVVRLLDQWRKTQSLEPKPHGGGRAVGLSEEQQAALREALEKTPDATLEELREIVGVQVGGQGSRVSIMCVFRALRRMDITRKKSR